MPRQTYATRVNTYIQKRNPHIPATSTFFAGSQAIARMSNGQGRPSYLWHDANSSVKDQTVLRTLSWVGFLLGWHVDHIKPVVKGGSYHVSNVRLLPPALNSFISGSGNWPHDKLNALIEHLGPEWGAELGIPEGFKSMDAEDFLASDFLKKQMQIREGA